MQTLFIGHSECFGFFGLHISSPRNEIAIPISPQSAGSMYFHQLFFNFLGSLRVRSLSPITAFIFNPTWSCLVNVILKTARHFGMSKNELFKSLLKIASHDSSLTDLHLKLWASCCVAWISCNCKNPIAISIDEVMISAGINSRVVFHGLIKDLISAGYIQYFPPYRNLNEGTIYICKALK
jgi:hypothetical protein